MSAPSLKVLTIFTALDKVTPVVDKVSKSSSSIQKKLDKISNKMLAFGGAVMTVAGGALNEFIKFEDKMTDIKKVFNEAPATFQQQFKKVEKGILEISKKTRTPIADLQEMSYQAGRIGISGKDMLPFLEVMNKFNVALGEDFPGGAKQASEEVTKLVYLFKDMDSKVPARELNRIGSAINDLVQGGIASAENLTNFSQRFSGLPEVIAPVSSSILALGTTLESMGTEWEIAASGSKRFLAVALNDLPAFAKQMGISKKAALDLIQTDSAQFIVNFAQSLKGLNAEQFQKKMKSLGLNLQGARDVIGKLASDKGLAIWNKNLAISRREIEAATSITDEYALKNDNSAGKLGQLKNAVTATAIEVGRALIPALTEVMEQLSPILNALATWIGQNPSVITGVVTLAAMVFSLGVAIKIFNAAMLIGQGIMVAYSVAKGIYLALFTKELVLTNANNISKKAFIATSYAYLAVTNFLTVAQTALAAATWASMLPILAVIVAILAIIAIFYYWDEICAWFSKQWEKFTSWIGELWDKVVKWFQDFDFVDFFKQIGNAIIEWMLFPLKSVLKLVSMIPGKVGEIAKQHLEIVEKVKFDVKEDKKEVMPNAVSESNQDVVSKLSSRPNIKDLIDINVNDKNNNISSVKSNNIPVRLNNTKIPTR